MFPESCPEYPEMQEILVIFSAYSSLTVQSIQRSTDIETISLFEMFPASRPEYPERQEVK